MNEPVLKRRIGVPGAVFTLVGYVIGASIFVLPGELGARAGPGLFASYLVAAGLAALACLAAAHLGSQVPVSGAIYVAVARTVGARAGFLVAWSLIAAVTVGVPLVAYGLADYLAYFVPDRPRLATAALVVAAFGLVNCLPVAKAVQAQAVMTVAFLLVVFGFGMAAATRFDPVRFTPLFPAGLSPVLGAAVAGYFSYTGFMAIADIAEELRNPGRTLPRALAASLVIVTAAYVLIALAVTGLLDWRSLAAVPAPVATAADTFLPEWVVDAISAAAILAAATSVHGVLLIHSRDVYALARARVFPAALARLSPATGIPTGAVLGLAALALAGVMVGAGLLEYALLAVEGVMFAQIMAGLAVLRMPPGPDRARFALPGPVRQVVGLGLIISSMGFLVVGAIQSPTVTLLFGLVLALGVLYYRLRGAALASRGVNLDELLASRPDP